MKNCAHKATIAVLCSAAICFALNPNPDNPPRTSDFLSGDCGGNFSSLQYFFWERNPILSNASKQAENKACCEEKIAQGLQPIAGMVRWGGEGCGRDSGYTEWIASRQQYLARQRDGSLYKPFGECADVILPSTPLDSADWPAGVQNAHFYDWEAQRLGGLFGKIGITGIFAADFFDCIPHSDTKNVDFSDRSINDFQKYSGITVPGSTTSARAGYILANCPEKWNEYICDGYATFYGRLCKQIKVTTGHTGFVGMQGTYDAPTNRILGRDIRLINQRIKENGGTFLRIVEVQGDACCRSPWRHGSALTYLGSFAAQAPDIWVGLQTAAPYTWPVSTWTLPIAGDNPFEESFKRSFSCLTTDAQRNTVLYKYLKGHYLVPGWGHMANTDGTVRRMVQTYMPQYGNAGIIPTDIWEMIHAIVPARPFGLAVYFSKGIADSYEKTGAIWNFSEIIRKYENGVFGAGYFLSDADIGGFGAHPENKPTGFVTVNLDKMPADERAQLGSSRIGVC